MTLFPGLPGSQYQKVQKLFESIDSHAVIVFIKKNTFLSLAVMFVIWILYELYSLGFTLSFVLCLQFSRVRTEISSSSVDRRVCLSVVCR